MNNCDITTTMNTENLVNQMVISLNRQDLITVIMMIDTLMADWDFTKELYERFSKEMKYYETEQESE